MQPRMFDLGDRSGAAGGGTSRRGFLKGVALATGALVIPVSLVQRAAAAAQPSYEITDWIRLEPSGRTIIGVSQCEVGQGVYTGLPQIVADELDADWASVSVEFVTGRDAYRTAAANEELQQFVGASMSATMFHDRLRIAGAQAREALVQAAAARFKARVTQCEAKQGRVTHLPTGRSLAYGELAADAAKLPLNPKPQLKAPSQRQLIGQNLRRLDTPSKVDGSAIFGIDVRVPDMLFGAVRMAPTQTGKVLAVKNEAAIRARPGIKAVVTAPFWPRPAHNTVIVVADSYWAAKQAADALEIDFDEGASAGLDSRKIMDQRLAALDDDKAVVATQVGNADAMLAAAGDNMIEARYHTPYLVHATMEPVVATAHVRDGEIEVWGPIQGQDMVRRTLGRYFNMAPDKVIVNTTFLGGSFGRKYVPDFVLHAAVASKAVGRPVKVIRSREDDVRHGYYRPCASARFRAVLGADGYPTALHARVVGESLYAMIKPKAMEAAGGWDETMLDSIYDLAYAVPNLTVDNVNVKQPIPVSFMRSVGSTSAVFFLESFINELADAANSDPYLYRRHLLAHDPYAIAVLDRVVEAAGWSKAAPAGIHRGFAFNLYTGRGGAFKTYVAQVVEVEMVKGRVAVRRVVCAVDTGTVINPGLVKANIEGGIGFALTNTLKSEITFANGAVEQSNFHDYPLLGISEMPRIEVVLVNSDRPPQGCGEVALAPVAPAVAQAVYRATKTRLRAMPFTQDVRPG
ncbi:xanthine dehydrogenase family protein molybdopterin-binding subunit [Rhodoplanes sp. Z2-YC6860]|uniref:xanthine dehydrogenase family protein molybdopterin-binding subunit n=1 Tax=Rhodoplanes sp. Z2-YC6860 TaxID=674703 RepID=UPI00078C52BA|nr:molybdopterin cofactor-binding domain-containing protein [Rhodoplanes sp. Z2-YC6860]AMN39279.1 isoquinoline 1-oxidoreductase [Rhodoplanes sp. Z2-YC6860]